MQFLSLSIVFSPLYNFHSIYRYICNAQSILAHTFSVDEPSELNDCKANVRLSLHHNVLRFVAQAQNWFQCAMFV